MKFLLTLLSSILLVYNIESYIVGIDLGSEYFKATIMRPGKPFTMLENLQSKMKTATGVYLKDDERLFGPETFIKKSRFPKNVLNFMDKYLGEKYGSEQVEDIKKRHFVSYDMVEDEDRQTILFKLNFNKEDKLISSEEMYGMLFRYIKFLCDKFTGIRITDTAVSVPSSWGYKKRHALSQAVKLSGFKLRGIITQNTAAAVHLMSTNTFNETTYYIFYNIGTTYAQATLAELQSTYSKDASNKTIEARNVRILAESHDENLGGRDFDFNLVKHLMDVHDKSDQKKGKPSVLNNDLSYKVAEKLLSASIKYKEILSANKMCGINVLGIEPGMNLVSSIDRETFEEINKELLEKVYNPIDKLFKLVPDLSPSNITQVELLGGGVRVPKIQEILKEKLGDNLIGTHMNGDDSMAFGTAYMAANFSKHFKTQKKVFVNNGAPFEIKITIDEFDQYNNSTVCDAEQASNETFVNGCIRKVHKATTLYKLRHGYDIARTVSFKHDSNVIIEANELKEGDDVEKVTKLMHFEITGFEQVHEKLKEDNITVIPKLNLRFKLSEEGLLNLKADSTYDVNTYFNRILPTEEGQKDKYEYLRNFTETYTLEELTDELAKHNLTSLNNTNPIYKKLSDVGKVKKLEIKTELDVNRVFTFPKPLNKTQFTEMRNKLDKIDSDEKEKEKEMEKRNSLETDLYAKKEWIESDDAKTYGKEEEIEKIEGTLKEVVDWYDEDGWNANFTELEKHHSTLRSSLYTIEIRAKKQKERKKAFKKIKNEFETIAKDCNKLIKDKPWLEEHNKTEFTPEYNKTLEWFKEQKAEQDKLALNEDPIVESQMIENKIRALRRDYGKMKMIPKPVETKPAFNETDGNSTNSTDNNSNSSEEGEKSEKDQEMEDLIKKMNMTDKDGNLNKDNTNVDELLKKLNENIKGDKKVDNDALKDVLVS